MEGNPFLYIHVSMNASGETILDFISSKEWEEIEIWGLYLQMRMLGYARECMDDKEEVILSSMRTH